ncbi:GNAT family N-acetyltransferase [Mycobacterium sp.]|jgi:RimJ/RimL family protein N-acetyltransferase|uniref:GNAT family N-acetyltransferase n=1 Tax=Mycobacterium sp. TaxID=1785 RepID=UPI002D73371A|nr:GNAT family N-acetyltransferase [Mycobacterium sp.]HZA10801.1 GNAT family N-acetyltransferase [Mycobacterium sp.]
MNKRVARLTEDDWALFADLRLQALSDAFGVDDDQYRREARLTETEWRYRISDHAPFAAWLCGRPVGIIAAHREDDQNVYLYSLWLNPAVRGHGLAHELVAASLDWARDLSARTVHLRVAADNAAARSVYESFGFTAEQQVYHRELVMSLTVG